MFERQLTLLNKVAEAWWKHLGGFVDVMGYFELGAESRNGLTVKHVAAWLAKDVYDYGTLYIYIYIYIYIM